MIVWEWLLTATVTVLLLAVSAGIAWGLTR